ncbi:hypothetical protein BDZ97DRAFT_1754497 [Flammula alnicola]|nr:hypothetical protein BDZ97DRAFT_1754497 [Flammula alnicola]
MPPVITRSNESQSRSTKAGLQFPVSPCPPSVEEGQLRSMKGNYAQLYLAAVLKNLSNEAMPPVITRSNSTSLGRQLQSAFTSLPSSNISLTTGNAARDNKKQHIVHHHLEASGGNADLLFPVGRVHRLLKKFTSLPSSNTLLPRFFNSLVHLG